MKHCKDKGKVRDVRLCGNTTSIATQSDVPLYSSCLSIASANT